MRSVDIQPNGETAEEPTLDDAIITAFAIRIAERHWRIEENRLRTTIIDTTPDFGPVGCCPVGVLALDTAPERLREILENPEHASMAAWIIEMRTDGWLWRVLEERHETSDEPPPDEDRFLRFASALSIDNNPRYEFAATVADSDLSVIDWIADASDNIASLNGRKLIEAIERETP